MHGFDSVSLRDLTQSAGVNLAAVNYHFGSKEGLIEQVVERAIVPVNEERIRMLDDLLSGPASSRGPTMEELLDAFLRPLMQQVRRSSSAEQLFYKLVGRCLIDRSAEMPPKVVESFQQVVGRFAGLISQCIPGLGHDEILWRMHFTAGALLQTLAHGEMIVRCCTEIEAMPAGDVVLNSLIAFAARGFSAPGAMQGNAAQPS